MHTPDIHLLPVPTPDRTPDEPVTHLLTALEHITKTFDDVAHDPDRREPLFHTTADRREQLFHAAASQLATTYPEDRQTAVYDRHAARCSSLTAAEQRTATLAMHGLASDRASGTRHRDGHTWEAAAIAAIELYRTRTDRPLRSISRRSGVAA